MAGSRHLRRLFEQHLGATPNAVAQTRRLHFAKKLIDETGLPMTQIATGTSRCGHCANRDAFPVVEDDLVRTLALGSHAEIGERSRAWRPWRAYAVAYLCGSAQSHISGAILADS
jgi:AraC-like DNA-binding protein